MFLKALTNIKRKRTVDLFALCKKCIFSGKYSKKIYRRSSSFTSL